jgi:hypothetical protein
MFKLLTLSPCGCEILSLIAKEEQRWKVFEIRVLGRMFEPKRENMTGG